MNIPEPPDGWVDEDEDVAEDQAADWDQWIAFLKAAEAEGR